MDGDVTYDPRIIRGFANWMYMWASVVTFASTIVGLALGAVFLNTVDRNWGFFAGLVGGGIAGYVYGLTRANALRLSAQLALCQVTIEENTRASHSVSAIRDVATATHPVPDEVGRASAGGHLTRNARDGWTVEHSDFGGVRSGSAVAVTISRASGGGELVVDLGDPSKAIRLACSALEVSTAGPGEVIVIKASGGRVLRLSGRGNVNAEDMARSIADAV